jgi:hypothetical protein
MPPLTPEEEAALVQQMMMDMILGNTGGAVANGIGPIATENLMGLTGGGVAFDDGEPEYGKNATHYNKVQGILADHINAGLAGPGAYGPDQFQMQYEYEPVDDGGSYLRAQNWLDTGGIEGIAARLASGSGGERPMSPTQIDGYVRSLYSLDPESEDYEGMRQEFIADGGDGAQFDQDYLEVQQSMPMFRDDGGGGYSAVNTGGQGTGSEPSFTNLLSTIESVWNDVTEASPFAAGVRSETNPEGQYVMQNGQLMKETAVPTEAMEKYDSLGLSYPTQQYDYDYFVNNSPELQQIEAYLPGMEAASTDLRRKQQATQPGGAKYEDLYSNMGNTPLDEDRMRESAPSREFRDNAPPSDTMGLSEKMYLQQLAEQPVSEKRGGLGQTETGDFGMFGPDNDEPPAGSIRGRLSPELARLADTLGRQNHAAIDPQRMARESNRRAGPAYNIFDRSGSAPGRQLTYYSGYRDPQYAEDRRALGQMRRQQQSMSGQQLIANATAQRLQREGRTPYMDQMRQRAMAAYLSGSTRGFY